MQRRTFIKTTAMGTAGYLLWPSVSPGQSRPAYADAVVVTNGEPPQLLHSALEALGGLQRFVSAGSKVVVKPNIGWDRPPELAANTNPQLIAEIVTRCFAAGAKEVKVFDRTCNEARRCYRHSGIAEAAKKAGAKVVHVRGNRFKTIDIGGTVIKQWPIYEEYLRADVVINVPIAKQHSLSRVTLGLKNLMGVMGGNRGKIHENFSEKLAEINGRILPALTIIDAYRILTANGPQGGSPDYVQQPRTLIASDCTVSADLLALELFHLKLSDVPHIKAAYDKGLAKYDPAELHVKRIHLS